jgi:hypothetical protein
MNPNPNDAAPAKNLQAKPTGEEIEEKIYRALMADIPDLHPFVARGLAKTAAARFRERGIGGRASAESPSKAPD